MNELSPIKLNTCLCYSGIDQSIENRNILAFKDLCEENQHAEYWQMNVYQAYNPKVCTDQRLRFVSYRMPLHSHE